MHFKVILLISESLWSILTFSRKSPDVLSLSDPKIDLPTAFKDNFPLANQSLLLMLILTNHNTTKDNPYRISLFGCSDAQELSGAKIAINTAISSTTNSTATTSSATPISSELVVSTFKIDFSALYNTLSRIVTINQSTLLLYLLLHRNKKFYEYVMCQENLQQLVIPILQTLYNAPDSTSHHIYMSLIVLLILSENDGFNKSVHQIVRRTLSNL